MRGQRRHCLCIVQTLQHRPARHDCLHDQIAAQHRQLVLPADFLAQRTAANALVQTVPGLHDGVFDLSPRTHAMLLGKLQYADDREDRRSSPFGFAQQSMR